MSSGEGRKPRGRNDAQGTLDGLLDEENAAADVEEEAPTPKAAKPRAARARTRSTKEGEAESDPLCASLDTLEQNIKLLLARHEEAVTARSAAEERSRSREGLDPVELQERVRTLAAEADRLERHAAFLEDRIRGLLSRVRYVIES